MTCRLSSPQRPLALLLCLIVACLAISAAESKAQTEIRRAVEKSLPFLEEKGVWWMGRKKCVSCHHTALLLWSHEEAARRGFQVDGDRLALWRDWSLTKQLSLREDGDPVGSRNLEGLSQLVLGSRHMPVAKDETPIFERFKDMLLDGQRADGLWGANGQLPSQKRPLDETVSVSTMWALLALDDFAREPGEHPRIEQSRAKAESALATSQESGLSTEWSALTMMRAHRQDNAPSVKLEEATNDLLSRQNSDGGWAWIMGDPSDALATGLALYGLMEVGQPTDHPAVPRAQQYLVSTQRPNGSWLVKSTKAKNKTEAIPTSIYLGSAWATIGLLVSLPDVRIAESSPAYQN